MLDYPMHGKPSWIEVRGGALFEGLPKRFRAGRYHSLYALRDTLPAELRVTAETEDGVVMAIEHAREAARRRAVPPGVDPDAGRAGTAPRRERSRELVQIRVGSERRRYFGAGSTATATACE